ncbi:MAG: hypothetical protein A3C02_01970 [Candidatus Andersenbacteria bacterium RIFCSPHIGHO2_02_FULL_45_11]|uniref:phenylalanine--tRNA ligase n=1 Tax=Candidatus Andersenbacteria bacterium RIFCSPHIGHO2_12_FULL_45_11 TaxID=1797281 RepID=A0A1G1X3W1_9BACT|nr:MAG: hypothetical protein A2805_01485 [Candidatus Andersenbacteria bacterium RIFCSPHIGHO2_01_FULL_46_36]OGY32950.1 MAG: hypothetical protein A3C02_01970 [Candidatus Andersenbacteria bacterium RIFCSPHIGHO2_02_FULL_45_11]OGY34702.1 MAG: hypothetical protein A3D99_05190 [Candidatus Andersenbacteria bacterium RIFCSPHIGHO2_12_FULL_45_11]
MKFSYQKIKKIIPSLTLSPKELAELLTMHAFETVVDREYVIDPSMTVVKILKLDPHPNADRLRLATVTDGTNEIRVVCGALNIEVGQIVPYAPPGARVYDEHGELFTLKEAVIRGETSPGMLNSVRELGISDDHGGILILPEDTLIGSKLALHIPSDTIFDADVLPDRAHDVQSEEDIAHEIAALLGLAKSSDRKMGTHTIAFNPDSPSKIAGVNISHEEVRDILERLGFIISPPARGGAGGGGSGDVWSVTVPSARPDVLGEHNLVDEVVRVHGLDAIPPSTMDFSKPLPVSPSVYWIGLIRRTLAESGFTETYSYSFEDERFAKLVNTEIHPHVELSNPMAPELKNLRYSMLPGLISAMVKSRDDIHRTKKNQERALFEIGRVYHRGDEGVVPGIIERPVIAGIAVGDEVTLQNIVDRIRELFQIEALTVIPAEKPFAKYSLLKYADEFFGIGYIFSNELLKKMKYRMPVIAFEISFNALMKHAPDVEIPVRTLDEIRNTLETPAQFVELPKYPSVFRDISMLVRPEVTVEQVQEIIERIGKGLVVDVDLFDEFTPLPLPEGELEGVGVARKSLAFHIEYRSSEKTLTDTEIAELHSKIEHALKKECNAEIR